MEIAKLSIIVPAKNREDVIGATLHSVASQSDGRWECIIVDDGSTDNTRGIVREHTRQDQRFKLVVKPDGSYPGAPAARNIGLSEAKSELVLFLDSDDLLAPEAVANRVWAMDQSASYDFLVWQTATFTSQPGDESTYWNCFTGEDDLDRFCRDDTPWQTSGPTWRKRALHRLSESLGRPDRVWNEQVRVRQDWLIHIEAISQGLKYKVVPEADSYWRRTRPGSISSGVGRAKQGHLYPILEAARVLKQRDLLTRKRADGLSSLLARTAWASAFRDRDRSGARETWSAARTSGLLRAAGRRVVAPVLSATLAASRVPKAGSAFNRLASLLLESYTQVGNSPTRDRAKQVSTVPERRLDFHLTRQV